MNAIQTWFLTKLEELFGLAKQYVTALEPIIAGDAAILLQSLLPIALTVVEGLATSGQAGKDKQSAAFASITAQAEAAGIAAGAQAVNLAIELAVANLKPVAATAPAPVTPAV